MFHAYVLAVSFHSRRHTTLPFDGLLHWPVCFDALPGIFRMGVKLVLDACELFPLLLANFFQPLLLRSLFLLHSLDLRLSDLLLLLLPLLLPLKLGLYLILPLLFFGLVLSQEVLLDPRT